MKSISNYIMIVFVLCFCLKAQAQSAIEEFNHKKDNLSTKEAEQLDFLIHGGEGYMFLGDNKQVFSSMVDNKITRVDIYSAQDLAVLKELSSSVLNSIVAISIEWDGSEDYILNETVFQQLKTLKYIYIRSYEELSKGLIEQRFQKLLELLNQKENVIVLYETMEQPS